MASQPRHLRLIILVLFYVWEDARVWAHWNYSFDLHLNYIGPVSYFSPSWISLMIRCWGWLSDLWHWATCFSSCWIPLRVHHWGLLEWLMAFWLQPTLLTEMARQHSLSIAPRVWSQHPLQSLKSKVSSKYHLKSDMVRPCFSEKKKKRGMSFFSSSFLRTKKIKRAMSRPEHS